MGQIVSLEALAAHVRAGMTLAVPTDHAGVAMAATAAIIANRPANLHLVCIPISGIQADMLIGEGLVGTLETSAVTLGEAGGAPRFNDGVRHGGFALMDATCPAILTGLIAGQKGVPFMPIRGLIGSDLMQARPDWKIIDNPFAPDDPIVVVPAIRPDVALFHAPEADRFGNVRIGRQAELATMAYAAKTTLVTVERIVETSLLADEAASAGVLPALYVTAIAEARNGAWPLGLWGEYPTDDSELARYARMARSADGFATYMKGFAQRLEAVA
ncbi:MULTISPECIES: CoA transferase [Rhodopseudomonas]|uniref:CoA synthetase n=1 Tax=Rhodopseudomonas palustris TaxID=1076 RepID=A0A0D7EKL8_RHOPL|nr:MULTISPECIES: CoA transferase [Rhodopseudomonas]KIZ41374.1 CoA synthetase [Rhodopseudomonas palustris]MDF3810254.1 CoA-transferase [Rhodopseudomonas sp. BAL398]WOK15719.1 CoA transferase [Rhodopseudomonas sp. BAL398]